MSRILVLFLWTVILLAVPCHAKEVTLQWDANTEPDIAGYKIYYSPSVELPFTGKGATEGESPVDVGLKTQVTLTQLKNEETQYFAVTAYNTSGYESSFSNVVSAGPEEGTVVNRRIERQKKQRSNFGMPRFGFGRRL